MCSIEGFPSSFSGLRIQAIGALYDVVSGCIPHSFCHQEWPEEKDGTLNIPQALVRVGCNRCLGYMAETLETLYFYYNNERNGGRLNIVHTLCRLYT